MKNIIKIDKIDRKILAELDINCRIPATQLAKRVRKSRQAAEYRINQLVKKGIITSFNANINPNKMGYKICKIYLQLRNIIEERKKLINYLMNSPIVNWLGECDGEWDLIFSIFVKTDYDFYKFKNKVISEFNKIILKEKEDIIIDILQYPKMYFTGKINPPVTLAGEIIENKLDEIDHKILAEIVNNARININELAKKIKSTPIIIRRKLKKIEQKGIINQYRIGVDLKKLNLELFKSIIHLERYTEEDEKKILTYINNLINIHYFIRNLSQIEIELVVKNYQEYTEIINQIKQTFPNIIRNIESVLMKTDIWTSGFKNLI